MARTPKSRLFQVEKQAFNRTKFPDANLASFITKLVDFKKGVLEEITSITVSAHRTRQKRFLQSKRVGFSGALCALINSKAQF